MSRSPVPAGRQEIDVDVDVVHAIGIEIYQFTDDPVVLRRDAVSR